MPLFVTVTPGTTVTNSTTLDATVLNLLGTPAIDVTGTVDGGSLSLSAGSVGTNELSDNAVTNTKLADMTGPSVKGRQTGTGDPENVTIDNSTVEIATVSSSPTLRVKDQGISYAKIQNTVNGSRLIGRAAAAGGTVGEIEVGTGLSLSTGGVLSNTATAKYYKSPSSLFLPSIAGAITPQEHGLSAIPNVYTAQFIYSNATASSAGYVNGDVVEMTSFYGQNYSAPCSLFSDGTYLYLRLSLNALGVAHKTTGAVTDITAELNAGNKWKFKLNAIAFPS